TVMLDSKGYGVFSGEEKLPTGIYLIVVPQENNPYFEILIDDDQKFKISTTTAHFMKDMKVKGSKSNVDFNQYQRKMADVQTRMEEVRKKKEKLAEGSDSLEIYNEQIRGIYKERLDYMNDYISKNEDALLAKIMNAMIDTEVPDAPRDADGNITDSTFQYRYYRKHYFDNIDFNEPGLVRTPVLEPRIDSYFKRMVPPVPDSITPEVNKLIAGSMKCDPMFRFLTYHLLMHFQSSTIMGMDKVFYYIAEDWYLSGEAYWADSAFLNKLRPRVAKLGGALIGNQAPAIEKVPTWDGEYASLSAIDADYTVIVFWEPNCGHCKKVVPHLYELYQDSLKAQNVEV
ncbi:MAG: DUF5106 domain-containing protein, partial [Desulfovibrionales bacterium]|nr:DUF5106 domain-containing protein [Desulfovibrionales bacterium]